MICMKKSSRVRVVRKMKVIITTFFYIYREHLKYQSSIYVIIFNNACPISNIAMHSVIQGMYIFFSFVTVASPYNLFKLARHLYQDCNVTCHLCIFACWGYNVCLFLRFFDWIMDLFRKCHIFFNYI
jgi:hypothetical protein